ncbi:hypothetical protein [Comamonas sp.]
MKKSLLSPWHTVVLMTVVGVLAACEPAPPAPKAALQAPSSAARLPPATTDAVQGLGGDAALVAQSAEKAESLPSTATPTTDASPLGALRQYVGTYPSDSNMSFLEQGVLAERLKHMLGKNYSTLLGNMRTVGPLTEEDGLWFITGNRPHEGGKEAAAVVVDATKNAVRVWMLHEGQVSEYLDPMHANVPWPKEVQTMLDNHKMPAKG